eukprot:TRINITY_DN1773_c1_g1_i1.p1 TRINITY_DN1773_c1_g1~~TRINITY_DN1773_c1_g1_i1.p1  ORF type:complete len:1569 (+),score=588.92 TRINITY_DN1773_c1_g1_i1:164-4708(+)
MSDRCNVTVTVRVRPILLNQREEAEGEGATCVSVAGNSTTIWDPADPSRKRTFTFDRSFDSISPVSPAYASQPAVYSSIGLPALDWAFKGYNATIFAYGQTGSGKTYTMLGHESAPLTLLDGAAPQKTPRKDVSGQRQQPSAPGHLVLSGGAGQANGDPSGQVHAEVGVIPRFCLELFKRVDEGNTAQTTVSHRVDCVYYEIYNEKVHDLLDPSGHQVAHRVREHPRHGPYVEGLQRQQVRNYPEVAKVLKRGAKERHTASTMMNDVSSRSHAVCELSLTTSKFDRTTGDLSETLSRIALVDLAGSERQRAAGTQGDRLKEGATINKSLLTLGNVIEALATNSEKASGRGQKRAEVRFVPYRDSMLTWLLREALGGNSRTVMVATISPSALNFEESLSTLKYADRAKKIQNSATVNRDSKKEIIFQLREEIRLLKAEIDTLRGERTTSPTLDWGGPSEHHAWVPVHAGAGDSSEAASGLLLRLHKPEPFLFQVEPLPTVGDAVMWSLSASSTYISCRDHTRDPSAVGRTVTPAEASSASPLVHAQRTIVLQRKLGANPYHCLFLCEEDKVLLHPTHGSPYDGRITAPPATPIDPQSPNLVEEYDMQVLVDGTPAVGGERLDSGVRIRIGGYEFIFIDPRESPDTLESSRVQQRLRSLERAKEQSDRSAQMATRRVAAILAHGGLDAATLPSETEVLSQRGHRGDEVVCRGPHGPAVYVWSDESPDCTPRPDGRAPGASGAGGWRPADSFEAELAATRAVDRHRAEVERGKKLATMLVDCVDMDELPFERDLPPGKGTEVRLVRCEAAGMRVVQWDKQRRRWMHASDPVADLTARQLREKKQRDKRMQESGSHLKELREKHAAADTLRQEVADLRARYHALEERHKVELEGARERELELQEVISSKDAMLRKHTEEAHAKLRQATREMELTTEDFEARLAKSQHICATLEDQYNNALYEWKKHEALLDASQGAKKKVLDEAKGLREELAERSSETDMLRIAQEKMKADLTAAREQIAALQAEAAERDRLLSERSSKGLQEAHGAISSPSAIHLKEEELESLRSDLAQVESNRKELSAKWLNAQEQLREQVSRNSQLREDVESLEKQLDAERDRVRELLRTQAEAQRDRDDVAERLHRLQEQWRKREEEDPRKIQLEDLKRRLQGLEEAKRQAEGSRTFAEQSATKERQKVSDLQSRLRETTQEYKKLKDVIEQSNEKSDRLRQQLKDKSDELASAKMQLQAFKTPQQGQQGMSAADALRKVSELTIQLEMARENSQSLEQRLQDAVMMNKRREEGALRMGQLKESKEEEIKRLKDQLAQAKDLVQATQARLDRKTDQVHRLSTENHRLDAQVKHLEGRDREASPPPAGRKTAPYGLSFPADLQRAVTTLATPRDQAPQQKPKGSTKRSHSQDSKQSRAPNYARPTDSWVARVEDEPTGSGLTPGRVTTTNPGQVALPLSARRPSDAPRTTPKRRGAGTRTAGQQHHAELLRKGPGVGSPTVVRSTSVGRGDRPKS